MKASQIYFDSALVIIGRIGSGKSTLAKRISKERNLPIASFGAYLRSYCEANGLPGDRDYLQDLGDKFITTEHMDFLCKVIDHVGSQSNMYIFEGVRHKVIFDGIKSMCRQVEAIFIDVEPHVRYEWVKQDTRTHDRFSSFERFLEVDNHNVEQEIESLKQLCSLIINSGISEYAKVSEFAIKIGGENANNVGIAI